tara:strand:+ start:188 stop:694 length:507 start_codon:yes stop_codon:yes gene_type:complete
MNALKYIAIGIGTFLGGKYLLSLNRASQKIITSVSGKKDKITTQGISILLSYNIKNPTRANMKMTAPLIKLSFNGELLASSTMQSVDIPISVKDSIGRIEIKAFKETGKITTQIMIPWLSVLSIGPQLMKRLKSQNTSDKIQLEIETISQVYTLAGDYPLEEITTIEL